jgi:hypothetical protein
MSKTIWRVEWDIDGGKGPRTSLELGNEKKATEWAEGLLKAGGKGIVVTELIVGRTIRFNTDAPLFQK